MCEIEDGYVYLFLDEICLKVKSSSGKNKKLYKLPMLSRLLNKKKKDYVPISKGSATFRL